MNGRIRGEQVFRDPDDQDGNWPVSGFGFPTAKLWDQNTELGPALNGPL